MANTVSAEAASDAKGRLREAAADWFVRLRSDEATGADWRAFEAWQSETEGAQAAFERLEAVWVDLDDLAAPAAIFPLPGRTQKRRSAFWPLLAAASVTGLIVGVGWIVASSPRQPEKAIYAKTRDVTIPGRGVIHPIGKTKVTLTPKGSGWVASLTHGEASITVRHDPARPVTIITGGEQIVDVGTVFDVRQDARGLRVAVNEGEVAVVDRQRGWNRVKVRAGQVLVRPPGDEGARLLTQGGSPFSLSYENAPLSRVLADLNRYYSRPVTIVPDAEALRFSGVLRLEEQERTLKRLAAFADLAVEHTASGLRLHRARMPGA